MTAIVSKLALAVFIAFMMAAIVVLPVRAQFPMSNGKTADRESSSERELEMAVAHMRYLIYLADKRKPHSKVDPKLALEQLQEDFTRLQIVNKDLILKSPRSDALDLKFVAKSAEEIHKRAERLLSNLALPEPEAGGASIKPEVISDHNQLMKAITAMGWLVYWFTKNPIFKEIDVIEMTASVKARRDLDQMVSLSLEIKRASDHLRQAAGK